MKRMTLAALTLTAALAISPGTAFAHGHNGSNGSSGSSNGSNGAPGTSHANCVGAISIIFSWFGFAGTSTQCQSS